MKRICANGGAELSDLFFYSQAAGVKPRIDMRKTKRGFMLFCIKCGTEVPENANFCSKCGSKIENAVHSTSSNHSGTFTDPRDGKIYKTVKIGKQTWMAENLNYEASGGKCYDNNPINAQKYGRLYNWETAKRVCPPSWHLPSNEEWQELVDFAGGDKIAGKKLKATNGWDSFYGRSGNGTDEYGFAALPGGYGFSNGNFYKIGKSSSWWTATENDAGYTELRKMYYADMNVSDGIGHVKTDLDFVRCVKN
jgi:uncharacterized protein (TIGR02145 family)